MRNLNCVVLSILFLFIPMAALAGDLDSPAAPTDAASAMYTLGDVYNRLSTGAAGAKRSGPFTEPSAGPAPTGHTLDEVMGAAPAVDDANGASAADVLTGKTFWGLTSGAWGLKTGNVSAGSNVNGADGSKTFTIPDGLYSGSKTATANDTYLTAGNIKDDVVIFGVTGTFPSDGTAVAGEVKTGSTFYTSTATKLTGTGTKTLSADNDTVNAGYYAATTLSAVDTDLHGANIVSGKTIFGKAGSAVAATGNAVVGDVLATKTFSNSSSAGLTGTMTNVGQQTITPTTTNQAITKGYHDGTGYAEGDTDLTAGNIKDAVVIFGVTGTFPSDGTAVAGDVKTGSTFYTSTATKLTGTGTKTLSADNDTVNAGYYAATTLSAVDTDLHGANIVSGKTIFGKKGSAVAATGDAVVGDVLATKTFSNAGSAGLTGTMTNNGAGSTITPGTSDQTVAAGYWSSANTVSGDTDLTAGNIKDDVVIFGVTGTYPLAGVAKTGQTTSYGTRDDGALQKGVSWPNPRFTDNNNGTVTDNLTGLIWLKNTNCTDTVGGVDKSSGILTWANALTWCNNLASGSCGLTDTSVAGDWRLPNRFELESLLDLSQSSPALPSGNPFTVQLGYYWSSSTAAGGSGDAWFVYLIDGHDGYDYKTKSYYVWPVRGGQ